MNGEIYVGIDIGSLSSEALLLGEEGIVAYSIKSTGANPQRAAKQCLEEALEKSGLDEKAISGLVVTGYGRIRVPFRAKQVTEITCHARGGYFLFPRTRTVIDIGGQDSKVITLDDLGRVTDFAMNDKCAAGTGRFLEVMAKALELKLSEALPAVGLMPRHATRHTVARRSGTRADPRWGNHLMRRVAGKCAAHAYQ